MKDNEADRSSYYYARSKAALYLSKQIDALAESKTQREIAKEMGYDKPNILSMFKRGESKIPIDRVPAMAKALHVDPIHLFRLVLEQHWPNLDSTVGKLVKHIVSEHEYKLILLWRAANGDEDPEVTRETLEKLVEQSTRLTAK